MLSVGRRAGDQPTGRLVALCVRSVCNRSSLGSVAPVKLVLDRLLATVRVEREAFAWLDLNDRATGDALVLVAVTRLLILLGLGWSLFGLATSLSGFEILIASFVSAAIFWLAYSGLVLAIVRFGFKGEIKYAITMRVTGFAYPTLLLTVFTLRLGLPAVPALLLGAVWFVFIVAHGVRYESELPLERCVAAAAGGLVLWVIVASIFGQSLI